jgi:nucleoside-diphosphate-sugar epimerase
VIHVEDVSRAFLTVLESAAEVVHNQAFNVGQTSENYQVRDIAKLVEQVVPGSKVTYAEGGGPDPRCYRVNFEKIATLLPGFHPRWTVPDGIRQLYDAFRANGFTADDLNGPRYVRLKTLRVLMERDQLDGALRWTLAWVAR